MFGFKSNFFKDPDCKTYRGNSFSGVIVYDKVLYQYS